MDLITHTFLGAATAHAVLAAHSRVAARPRVNRIALLLGGAGAFVPDLDFFLKSFADPAFPIELHRHFTHSLAFVPMGGLIAALPFMLFPSVRREWRLAIVAAIIGCATHALLDCCTSYGTLWYWPFSDRFVAWDLIAIIDPLFTLPLIIGVVVAWRKSSRTATVWALIWAVFYMSCGYLQRERALSAQRTVAAERGHDIERGRVFPTLGNILYWRSVYLAEGRLWVDGVALNGPVGAIIHRGESIAHLTAEDLPPSAQDSPRIMEVFDKMWRFADGFTAVFPEREGEMRGGAMFIGDMRYSRDMSRFQPLWGIRIDPAHPFAPVSWSGWRTSAAEAVDGEARP